MSHPRPKTTVAPESQTTAHIGHSFLRLRRVHLALGAMGFAGAMVCMPALPASAEVVHAEAERNSFQSLSVSPIAGAATVVRQDYTIRMFSVVQMPVPPGTTISSGFGYRAAPCAECSSYHEGVDWLPGAGSPVLAIADGVVTDVGNPSGSLGVYLTVEHVIDGETVSSTYGHLAYGSMNYSIGSTVTRGDVVGLVGSTGTSTGPHLYFQIRVADGSAINPLPWLAKHVNV